MTVVVVHNPSATSSSALSAGRVAAERLREPLCVVGAWSGSPAADAEVNERAMLTDRLDRELAGGVTWELDLVNPGQDAIGAVIDHVNAAPATVVVIGTRHRSAVGKMLLGRSQQRLLLDIDHPTLLVKVDRH